MNLIHTEELVNGSALFLHFFLAGWGMGSSVQARVVGEKHMGGAGY